MKGKKQDLEKAIHFIEMIIERDYGEEAQKSQVFESKVEKPIQFIETIIERDYK